MVHFVQKCLSLDEKFCTFRYAKNICGQTNESKSDLELRNRELFGHLAKRKSFAITCLKLLMVPHNFVNWPTCLLINELLPE